MLLTRVITALVLLPLVVAAMLLLPTSGVAVIVGAVMLVGAWEWGGLTGMNTPVAKGIFTALTAAALLLLTLFEQQAAGPVLLLAVLWWILAVVLLLRFPHGWDLSVGVAAVSILLGLLILCAPYLALVRLHGLPRGPELMLCLFVLIWAADTGAYFAGRGFGRHKLAPRISPGKTREGAVGGILLTLTAAGIAVWWFDFAGAGAAGFVMLAGVVALVSIVGDLTISMFKRQAGMKDTGRLFPGHGGVLDRLDSLVAAAPWFVLGLALLPR